ncbi:MAG: DUF4422 domain-containing protein [Clostridia bacterium]|nr:DUF4422 domain-containing protein [Clostridia bacterium]
MQDKSDIKIIVATHKKYRMPQDEIYFPLLVGGAGKTEDEIKEIGYQTDNTGENISNKNSTFCELTGLYWAWKNLNAEIYGLCHYRRYLGNEKFWKKKSERLLTADMIRKMVTDTDIILPHKRHYWIETRGSQYAHAHHRNDLLCTEAILKEKYPEYLPAWYHMLQSRSGHICNMFIMKQDLFDEYCSWLFDILFEAEHRLDISEYSQNDQRVFGFLGERLLDVWVETKQLRYAQAYVINMEKQHWLQKGYAFLKRKWKS